MIYFNGSLEDFRQVLGPTPKDWVTIPPRHALVVTDRDRLATVIRPYKPGDEAYDVSVPHQVLT